MKYWCLNRFVQGSLDPLTSRFHLSYNMLLNLLATGEITPEQMMELSFRKYQNTMEVPELSKGEDRESYGSYGGAVKIRSGKL